VAYQANNNDKIHIHTDHDTDANIHHALITTHHAPNRRTLYVRYYKVTFRRNTSTPTLRYK